MYRTILIPLDGSPLAERAVPYAASLAEASGARLLLLQVVASHPPNQGPALRAAQTYLAGVAAQLRGGPVVETVVFSGTAAAAILEEARVRRVDLIAMSAHGQPGLGRRTGGRVVAEVLRRAEVPVLLIPDWTTQTWRRAGHGCGASA